MADPYVKLDLITGDAYTQTRVRHMETQYELAIAMVESGLTQIDIANASAGGSAMVAANRRAFLHATFGAALAGFGTDYDSGLWNRQLQIALGVVGDTQDVNFFNDVFVGNTKRIYFGSSTVGQPTYISETVDDQLDFLSGGILGLRILAGALAFGTTLTPAALSGNQNDWAPTGVAGCFAINVDCGAADRTITGLAAGQVDGTVKMISNVSANTARTLFLATEVTSTAVNRFRGGGGNITLTYGQSAIMRHDGVRWNAISAVL